jgi:ankyrin repeat protein
VVLDANPLADIANSQRIHAVIQGGRVLLRPALDSMLARVERRVTPSAQAMLWIAAIAGDTVGITAALRDGAKVDSLDGQGNRRAMNYAALGNHVPVLRLLIARGASINLGNRTGFTPLHHAAEAGSNAALAALLEAGADPALRTTQGILAIDIARRRGDQTAMRLLEAPSRRP